MNYLTDELAAAGKAALRRTQDEPSSPYERGGGAVARDAGADTAALEPARISVERALDEFDRGRAICIEDKSGTVLATSAQSCLLPGRKAGAKFGPHAPQLVLTTRRARAMGLRPEQKDGVVQVPLPAVGAARLVSLATGIPCPRTTAGTKAADEAQARLAWPILMAGGPGAVAAVTLAKQARLLPCAVIEQGVDRENAARLLGFEPACARAPDIMRYASLEAKALVEVARARVPLAESEFCTFVLFGVGGAHAQHLAIVVGQPDTAQPVAVRLHSACLTGDVFASLRCDCGSQLRQAVDVMAQSGGGVLLYLPQEGRGIGLANKLHAYGIQDTGLDTLDADAQLGFSPDERSYESAVSMLESLGVSRVRLLTNNPHKLAALRAGGIDVVERLPLVAAVNPHNRPYLEAKAQRAGHMLSVDESVDEQEGV